MHLDFCINMQFANLALLVWHILFPVMVVTPSEHFNRDPTLVTQ